MDKRWIGLALVGIVAACEPLGPEACYLGPDEDDSVCFDLVPAEEVTDPAYDYPEPLGGSIQYAAPTAYLDLSAIDGGTAIAPNFVLRELARRSSGQYAVVQTHAVQHLQDIRDAIGTLSVNSGYRSPGHNESIPGSATYSRHQFGDAFDMAPAEVTLDRLSTQCNREDASFVLAYSTHIHCDWREEELDEAFYGEPTGNRRSPTVTSTEYRVSAHDPSVHDPQPTLDAWIELHDGVLEAPTLGMDEGEPLRDWTAFDAEGRVIETYRGTTYVAPPGAAHVEVLVGLLLTRALDLSAAR